MRASHRFRSVLAGLLLVLGAVGFTVPGRVSATTGPTDFLPPTPYHVPFSTEQLYIGQYVLQSVDPHSRLNGGAFGIEIDADKGVLVGIAQFFGYDPRGDQSVWVADLYNFHTTKAGHMTIDLVGPTGVPLFGRLYLTRTAKGDLVGQITLGKSPTRYAISIQKLNSNKPPIANGA
jgi:hypothetical protein